MTGYTYEYNYRGWTSTGILGISTKVTGGIIEGRLFIESAEDSTVYVAVRFFLHLKSSFLLFAYFIYL